LYKHFGDRSGLLAAAATDAALELSRTLSGAVERSGADAPARLQALAAAYRSFALATPRAAALIFAAIAPDATPTPESQKEAARPVLQVAEAIVGPTRALAAARVLTAFAYGFASMESAGAFRFGGEVEEAYRLGISVLASGLEWVAADVSRQGTSQASGGAAG
jgi:AcrR family transcriptional regulator